MLDYSLTYDQKKRNARMIIPQSGMVNFAHILRICRNLVEVGIRNAISGA